MALSAFHEASDFNRSKETRINWAVALFLLGWMSQAYTLFDVGKYSIVLIYLAALPFCVWTTSRSIVYLILPLVSGCFAAVIGVLKGISAMSVLSQFALQLLAIFFAAGMAAIDWRKHFTALTKMMTAICVPVIGYGGYQMLARAKHWKFAFLPVTNQQAYATGGLQRGWEKDNFTRASSVFAEPSELGYVCVWLLMLGLCAQKGRWRTLALAMAFSGFLFAQSLSGVLAAGIILLAYVGASGINWNVVRQVFIVLIFCAVAVVLVQPLAPEAFEAYSTRIQQALTLDNRADSGRVDHLPANIAAFMEEPIWGHGIASISSTETSGDSVTTFTYFLMLIERGFVGAVFFFVPWVWLTWRSIGMAKADEFRTLCIMLSVLNLYTFWVSSIAYSLQSWFSLGICASCILHTYLPRTQMALVDVPGHYYETGSETAADVEPAAR